MNAKDENNYVFNLKSLRWMGLYQIVDPATKRVFGHNVYRVVALCANLVLIVTVTSVLHNMYYLTNMVNEFTFYFGCMENSLFSVWKMSIILYRSEDIWKCMQATGLDTMAYRHYDRNVIKKWRSRSLWITCIYIVLTLNTLISWSAIPLVFDNTTVSIRYLDDTYGKYRVNILNFFTIVSDQWYNDHFVEFYIAEFVIICSYLFTTILFDIFTFTFMFTLYYQMEMISDAVQSYEGHEVARTASTDNLDIKDGVSFNIVRDKYDDLPTIFTDHQHVLKLLQDYLVIVRSTFLIQIVVVSSSLIIIIYISLISLVTGNLDDFILTIKLIFVLPTFIIQLLMTCYLFETLNEKRDSIVFALYSSNWTEMDLESRKLILFAMKLNNACQLKLKLTSTKIVNLEMFTRTIRTCYSIISMLSNYNPNKTK